MERQPHFHEHVAADVVFHAVLGVVEHQNRVGLRDFFDAGRHPSIGHVAWLVDDLEAESARLTEAGMPVMHSGSSGPVRANWHDGGPVFGHPIEVHRSGPELLGFYELIAGEARNWDGSRPLRPAPVPEPAP